jgi:hypothetical protein
MNAFSIHVQQNMQALLNRLRQTPKLQAVAVHRTQHHEIKDST